VSEVTESWIREYLEPRYPELVAPYREAESIRDAALVSGQLSESSISLLVKGAKSPRTPLGENISGMLGSLADQFPQVKDAIRAMFRDKKMHVRINALWRCILIKHHRSTMNFLRRAFKIAAPGFALLLLTRSWHLVCDISCLNWKGP
jgi:hypothetical protein